MGLELTRVGADANDRGASHEVNDAAAAQDTRDADDAAIGRGRLEGRA